MNLDAVILSEAGRCEIDQLLISQGLLLLQFGGALAILRHKVRALVFVQQIKQLLYLLRVVRCLDELLRLQV